MKKLNREEANKIVGQKVRIISVAGGHELAIGSITTIKQVNYGNPSFYYHTSSITNLKESQFELILQTKEEITKELKSLKKIYEEQTKELKDRLEYLKLSNSETYNENEFRVYLALRIIDTEKNEFTKAKLIAKLLN